MKPAMPPPPAQGSRDSIVSRVVTELQNHPGEWYDVTDEFSKGATTGAASNLYRYAGRFLTPLAVVVTAGRIYAVWEDTV